MKPIRVAAKAVIVQDGKLLVTKHVDREGPWYLLPGGGQEAGEPVHETLRRECREEIGVEVRELLYVRDYIGHHEFAEHDGDEHTVELMFACAMHAGQVPRNGPNPDNSQVGVAWLALGDLDTYRLYPKALKHVLAAREQRGGVYLGDVN